MERATLRQIPWSPPGPVAPAEAFAFVIGEIPGLDEQAAGALAQIVLAGRSRQEIDGLSDEDLADALTRARKALRRRAYPLPGSGWCERAERLISDRMDGALKPPGPARLGVHLANCPRCVEHDRRLGQCQDALVAGFVEAHAAKGLEASPDPVPPRAEAPVEPRALRVVETPALTAPPPPEALPAAPPPEALPAAPPPRPLAAQARQPEEPPSAPSGRELPRQVIQPAAAASAPSWASSPAPSGSVVSTVHSGSWADVAPQTRAQAWERPRPALASRTALATESTWVTIGPLLAVLLMTVVVFVLAGTLAYGS